MTQKRNDGGPAFPIVQEGRYDPQVDGMSLHQWYAGQALGNQAICSGSASEYQVNKWFGDSSSVSRAEIVAMQAREYADAMIAAQMEGDEG